MLMDYCNSDFSVAEYSFCPAFSFFSNQNVQMFLDLEPHASSQSHHKTGVCITCEQ